MREIKYRGKRLECEEHLSPWVEGDLFHDRDCWGNITGTWIYEFDCQHGRQFQHEVDPATVGQYTGLKDKNGKEIWEGDIVSSTHWSCNCLIKWIDGGFTSPQMESAMTLGYQLQNDAYHHPEFVFKVIGNIHDNPELLEV